MKRPDSPPRRGTWSGCPQAGDPSAALPRAPRRRRPLRPLRGSGRSALNWPWRHSRRQGLAPADRRSVFITLAAHSMTPCRFIAPLQRPAELTATPRERNRPLGAPEARLCVRRAGAAGRIGRAGAAAGRRRVRRHGRGRYRPGAQIPETGHPSSNGGDVALSLSRERPGAGDHVLDGARAGVVGGDASGQLPNC